jgi:hypothetical protein
MPQGYVILAEAIKDPEGCRPTAGPPVPRWAE